ncbi:anti-sigma factor family protein [Aliikangiella sp. IMCC44653]
MMPTCKQVAEQLSHNIDTPITGLKRMKLKLHLIMCRLCRRYQKQINISAQSIRLVNQHKVPDSHLKLTMLNLYKRQSPAFKQTPKTGD